MPHPHSCEPGRPRRRSLLALSMSLSAALLLASGLVRLSAEGPPRNGHSGRGDHNGNGPDGGDFDRAILRNAERMMSDGRHTFRFDTFGDEAFWGGALKLHQAIEGAAFGGVGAGVSPRQALALGLKVDADALPEGLVRQLRAGRVNLDAPATTLALLKLNAVVGVTGYFNRDGSLRSMGIQCALCHSTVDNSLGFGIGRRLDGWANHDLNVGAIIAAAPDLSPVVNLLRAVNPAINDSAVRSVLNSWGPGMFDAELLLDGKTTNPTTGKPSATLIPNALGLAGYNLHTWTGGWGTVPYWNAFVAVLEMHGAGTFFDPRLDDPAQFPVAAAAGLGHVQTDPDSDRVTKQIPALQFYQLSIPAPKPKPGVDFDPAAASRGDKLFGGKARCGSCHVEPLWTEPGWNTHKPADIKIESFQADRSPDRSYKTANLAGLFVRERGLYMDQANRGGFYHDGRFKTLLDVVTSYDQRFGLGLTGSEKSDLVEYLKSL